MLSVYLSIYRYVSNPNPSPNPTLSMLSFYYIKERVGIQVSIEREDGSGLDTRWVTLLDIWADWFLSAEWIIQRGDKMHVFADFNENGIADISEWTETMVIIHPDILLTGTLVASTSDCKRLALLNDEYIKII